MFERFTDRARRVLVLAQEEARRLDHNFIGTEHILLGLIDESEGAAAQTLASFGITREAVRDKVLEKVGPGPASSSAAGSPPFTARAKKVLELSLREALQLGHNFIGTEHMLLGLVREGEGVGAQVLVGLGGELQQLRQKVIELLGGAGGLHGQVEPVWPGRTLRARRTPAGERADSAAQRLAAGLPAGTQHMLLALLDQEDSVAANVLAAQGVTRAEVERRIADTDVA